MKLDIIPFIRSPDNISCLAACLAMLTDNAFTFVKEQWPTLPNGDQIHWKDEDRFISEFMTTAGLENELRFNSPDTLMEGEVYLLVVPSINTPGVWHSIVVDFRSYPPRVLDPNMGRKQGQAYFYVWPTSQDLRAKNQIPLTSWLVRAKINYKSSRESES